jgi:hypothetical protein
MINKNAAEIGFGEICKEKRVIKCPKNILDYYRFGRWFLFFACFALTIFFYNKAL